jgi:acetyltransferase-like isoleucine patch superfamily enzyme
MSRDTLLKRVFKTLADRVLGPGGDIIGYSYRGRNVSIGEGSNIGRGTILRDDITIGRNTRIGDLCVLEGVTSIGDHTDIESQCHITKYSRIGNHVFVAPFFLSTNDNRMKYHRKGHGQNLKGVIIKDNVRIAGHVMTLSGITIGEGAIVGSFSLVTKDVKPYTLVYGIPAMEREDKYGLLGEKVLPQFK